MKTQHISLTTATLALVLFFSGGMQSAFWLVTWTYSDNSVFLFALMTLATSLFFAEGNKTFRDIAIFLSALLLSISIHTLFAKVFSPQVEANNPLFTIGVITYLAFLIVKLTPKVKLAAKFLFFIVVLNLCYSYRLHDWSSSIGIPGI